MQTHVPVTLFLHVLSSVECRIFSVHSDSSNAWVWKMWWSNSITMDQKLKTGLENTIWEKQYFCCWKAHIILPSSRQTDITRVSIATHMINYSGLSLSLSLLASMKAFTTGRCFHLVDGSYFVSGAGLYSVFRWNHLLAFEPLPIIRGLLSCVGCEYSIVWKKPLALLKKGLPIFKFHYI